MMMLMQPGETVPDPEIDRDRDRLLNRYRDLRRISLEHHRAAMQFTSTNAYLDRAKRVGLGDGRSVDEINDTEHALLADLTLYTSLHGRSRPIDRFANAAKFAPESDEALLLAAMRRARFSVWEIRRRHPTAGLILYDLQRLTETWLMDINLTDSAPTRAMFAGRVFDLEGFSIGCGVFAPVSDDVYEQAVLCTPGPIDEDPAVLAEHPRFATELYRGALLTGLLDRMQFRSVA